jgi:hypothetical protein
MTKGTFLCAFRVSVQHCVLLCARLKQLYFKHGHADRNRVEGGGSPLFMLNVHVWQFGRPQPRTMSVQERQAYRANKRKESNRKRELRKPYTQERAARRRAMQPARAGAACPA